MVLPHNTKVNAPIISEAFTEPGSVTVPSGEIWVVSIFFASRTPSGGDNYVAGPDLFDDGGIDTRDWERPGGKFWMQDVVLTGGDIVELDGIEDADWGACYIYGFEVSDYVANDPISVAVDDGETVSVPSGEIWKGTLYVFDTTGSSGNNYVVGPDIWGSGGWDERSTDDGELDILPGIVLSGDEGHILEMDSSYGMYFSGWEVS